MKKFRFQLPGVGYQVSGIGFLKNRRLKPGTRNPEPGFTLIELLVAISIIGVLSTLVLANFNAARERARDTQRKSDLRQVQNALRAYYNDIGVYPAGDNTSGFRILGCGRKDARVVCGWGASWKTDEGQTYIEALPRDPKSDWSYRYERTSLDNYSIAACLENKSDTAGKAVPTGYAGLVCETGWMYEMKQ